MSTSSYTEATTFRPRNGLPAECYWRVRAWCEKNGFSLSDVLNSVLVPLAYHLENYCEIVPDKNMATVSLNIGDLDILHVFGGKSYPLASSVTKVNKNTLTLEEIEKRIAYWSDQNKTTPDYNDLLLLNSNSHARQKIASRKPARSHIGS